MSALAGLLSDDDSSPDLRRVVDTLRRRYASLVFTTLAALVVVAYLVATARPVYSTTARLLVDPIQYNIQQLDSGNPLSNILAAGVEHSVTTQAHIINTSSFLNDVYRTLKID